MTSPNPTPQPLAPRPNRSLVLVLWANAALLAVIALVLLNRAAPSPAAAFAQNQPPIAGGAGVFVMPGQFRENVWGCYLLDVDNKTICAYQYFPGDKKLRLAAARSYRWDTKLESFNADTPTPRDVKRLVEAQQAGNAPGAVAPPADPPAVPEKENK